MSHRLKKEEKKNRAALGAFVFSAGTKPANP
jgi:hypothetical protein